METLSFRHIGVVEEEYGISTAGMKMFGVLDLETQMEGCRFSMGLKHSHPPGPHGCLSGLCLFQHGVQLIHTRGNVTIMILERHIYSGLLRRVRRRS